MNTEHKHPKWRILERGMYLGFLALFMWFNASSFDKTEIATLIEFGGILFGIEVIKNRASNNAEE